MISVLVATLDHGSILPETLGALVPAALDGLVREVIVADGGSADATLGIADAFGADVLDVRGGTAARLNAAATVARGAWLMFLPPGLVLEGGFEREFMRFLDRPDSVAARFRPTSATPLADTVACKWRAWSGRASEADGLLIRSTAMGRLGGFTSGRHSDEATLRLRGIHTVSLPVTWRTQPDETGRRRKLAVRVPARVTDPSAT